MKTERERWGVGEWGSGYVINQLKCQASAEAGCDFFSFFCGVIFVSDASPSLCRLEFTDGWVPFWTRIMQTHHFFTALLSGVACFLVLVLLLFWVGGIMLLRLKQLDVRRNDCEISDRVFVRRAFERNTPSSQSRSRISAFLSGLTFLPFRKAVAILAAFKGLW